MRIKRKEVYDSIPEKIFNKDFWSDPKLFPRDKQMFKLGFMKAVDYFEEQGLIDFDD